MRKNTCPRGILFIILLLNLTIPVKTEALSITQTGVGIGTDAPSESLEVVGNVKVSGTIKFPDGSTQDTVGGNTASVSVITTKATLSSANRGIIIVSGNTTLTLPSPSPSNEGWLYTIKKADSGTRVKISGIIDGSSNWSIHEQYGTLTIASDGSSWLLVSMDRANRGNILYSTAPEWSNGNIGGRAGADALCNSSTNKPVGFISHAFISISVSDSIAYMPANYSIPSDAQIASVTGQVIAKSWDDLLDGNIFMSLLQSTVLEDASDEWWSGSDMNGNYIPSCGSFSSNIGSGTVGSSDYRDSRWISLSALCGNNHFLLCIAY